MRNKILRVAGAVLLTFLIAQQVSADGLVVRPIAYEGSLNERSQEAIIILHKGDKPKEKQVDAKKAEQQKLRNQREKWQEWRRANAEEKKLVAQLNEQLSKLDQYEVRVANALWAEKTYPFNSTVLDSSLA